MIREALFRVIPFLLVIVFSLGIGISINRMRKNRRNKARGKYFGITNLEPFIKFLGWLISFLASSPELVCLVGCWSHQICGGTIVGCRKVFFFFCSNSGSDFHEIINFLSNAFLKHIEWMYQIQLRWFRTRALGTLLHKINNDLMAI